MSLHRDEVSPFTTSPDDPNKPGWGFGISYRFTSTKDPQKNAAAAKPASGAAK